MIISPCPFCHQELEIINHTNSDLLDVYLCQGCRLPEFSTRFRCVTYKNEKYILATTITLDDFFIELNYAFNFTNRRTNYTKIYKGIIGELDSSLDLTPITWASGNPVCDFDFIMKLPLHDPASTLQKLRIYTTFS